MSDDCHFMGISFMECGMLHFFCNEKNHAVSTKHYGFAK